MVALFVYSILQISQTRHALQDQDTSGRCDDGGEYWVRSFLLESLASLDNAIVVHRQTLVIRLCPTFPHRHPGLHWRFGIGHVRRHV